LTASLREALSPVGAGVVGCSLILMVDRGGEKETDSATLLLSNSNLFRISSIGIETHFRFSPLLWGLLASGMAPDITCGNYEPTPSNFGASSSALTLDSPPTRIASANAPNASQRDSGAFFRDARMYATLLLLLWAENPSTNDDFV